jgi:hypothetical protein
MNKKIKCELSTEDANIIIDKLRKTIKTTNLEIENIKPNIIQ